MRTTWLLGLGAAALVAAGAAAGCGSDSPSGFGPGDGTDGGLDNDSSDPMFSVDGGSDGQLSLVVTPPNPVLTYAGMPVSQAFQASLSGMPVTANWSLDNVGLGSIDATGLFSASGTLGGVANVTATAGMNTGSTTVTVNLVISENPGNISAAIQSQLKKGGSADGAFRWLYPYDKTVFPRGLTPPTMQFDGTAPDAVYVHVTSKYLTYDGFYGGSNPSRVDFSAATWNTIAGSAAVKDPVTVQVTKISGGQVTGPITETWTMAQGSLKGTVYYNSYTSSLAGGGATLKIKVGTSAAVLLGGCHVCHAVSANGNVLAESDGSYVNGNTFDLTKGAATMASGGNYQYDFAGIYPDGSKMLTCGTLSGSWPPNVPGLGGDYASALVDTKTGNTIPAKGLTVQKALMPAFSPDGTMVAFNHYETTSGHTLSTMTFDTKTNTFGSLTDVVTDMGHYLGWPAFLPDTSAFIFHTDSRDDYATWSGAKADLSIVDLKTKKATALDALNGMSGSTTYLPYGSAEQDLNYEPTVLPEAVGGYYWVLFTSRRQYGNTIVTGSQDDTPRKKLWIAAIDINATPGKDPSHPAFYLPGQEEPSGNMRGFWALDPCKMDGNTCETADECCGGFCRQVTGSDGGIQQVCVPPPTGCAMEFEKCTTAADCCGADQGYLCVNGRCAKPPPPN